MANPQEFQDPINEILVDLDVYENRMTRGLVGPDRFEVRKLIEGVHAYAALVADVRELAEELLAIIYQTDGTVKDGKVRAWGKYEIVTRFEDLALMQRTPVANEREDD